eukprot:GFUD01138725.1.p1 GENE.GFUD01138725.1~~GFUD01138725.1.p1  ORF type:complete len:283 (+),score=66.08 GFUD01138725.1:53-901(+)
MALPKLSKCLEPNSIIPTDITFVFQSGGPRRREVKKVKAQKVILAIASDVFEKEFYGDMKETKDEIAIVDASQEVFQAMVDFIYNKQPNWKDFSVSFLCSLYYLGEKYNIGDLKAEIIATISDLKITKEKVLEIAHLAVDNSHHEPLSETLYDVAAAVLKAEFKDKVEKVYEFFEKAEFSQVNAVVMFKLMSRLRSVNTLPSQSLPSQSQCWNCQHTPCLDGQEVTKEKVSGARMHCGGRVLVSVGGAIYDAYGSPYIKTRFEDGGNTPVFLNMRQCEYKCP